MEFADIILLNKVDLMPRKGRKSISRLHQAMQQLNPRAKIVESDHCNVPLTAVLNTGVFDMEQVGFRALRAGLGFKGVSCWAVVCVCVCVCVCWGGRIWCREYSGE